MISAQLGLARFARGALSPITILTLIVPFKHGQGHQSTAVWNHSAVQWNKKRIKQRWKWGGSQFVAFYVLAQRLDFFQIQAKLVAKAEGSEAIQQYKADHRGNSSSASHTDKTVTIQRSAVSSRHTLVQPQLSWNLNGHNWEMHGMNMVANLKSSRVRVGPPVAWLPNSVTVLLQWCTEDGVIDSQNGKTGVLKVMWGEEGNALILIRKFS